MGDTILVTGATGRVGRRLVDELLASGVPVRALARNPRDAGLPSGVEVIAGDLTVPDSLDSALRGVAAVFLLWTALPETAGAVVRRIADAGARIVLLSSPHRTPHPFFQQPNRMAAFHAALEQSVRDAVPTAAVVRPGMFASNTVMWWAPMLRAGDVVRWPHGDVETAPIDERDIAAVAARCLTDQRFERFDDVITGPQSLRQKDQVAILGEALGRNLRFEELTPDAFRERTRGAWPPAAVEMLLAAWGAAAGQAAYVTSNVAAVTGRPARSFAAWARDNAAAFGGAP